MKSVAVLLLAVSLGSWWRETSSHAAAKRGEAAYAAARHQEAVKNFSRAHAIDPSPQNAFNLGTAQIAAGDRERGSATLSAAIEEPALRADAFYNRGNSALAAKAVDHAIRDYVEALKAKPGHLAAKRNLEIALRRREEERRNSRSGAQQPNPADTPQQPQPAPSPGQQPKPGELDLEALLRSVQQQEQDELRRMKGKAGEVRVGW